MGKLRVLSKLGDSTTVWEEEAAEAVREAERIFNEERARGSTAFRVRPDAPAERIEEFDPKAEHIVMVPRVAGG